KHGYRFRADVRVIYSAPAEAAHEDGAAFSEGDGEGAQVRVSNVEEETHVDSPEVERRSTSKFKPVLFAAVILVLLFGAALFVWLRRTPAPTVRSIAVLPFKPLEGKGGDPSLELGMTDSMIMSLSNTGRITVLPLSAVRRYTALDQDAIKAGRGLGVDAVLDGSIQRSQDRIRVRVNLVRVSDGQSLWTGQFDEKFTDIFTVQDVISRRAAAALQLKLADNETRRMTKRYTENTDAYQ